MALLASDLPNQRGWSHGDQGLLMRGVVAFLFAAVVALLVFCFAIDGRMDRIERRLDVLVISVVRI